MGWPGQNSLKWSDPSGHEAVGALLGGLAGGIIGTISYAIHAPPNATLGDFFGAFGKGALVGAAIGWNPTVGLLVAGSQVDSSNEGAIGLAVIGCRLAPGVTGAPAEGAVARSAGAMALDEALPNWSPKSVKTWGHTFLRHGEGEAADLLGRAAGTGEPQGLWLDNQAAADFLSAEQPYIQGPAMVTLPANVPAQVILPNGTRVPAFHAVLIPKPGGFVTAYPVVP